MDVNKKAYEKLVEERYFQEWLKKSDGTIIILIPRWYHDEVIEWYIHDCFWGRYWKLKRELTNEECWDIDLKRRKGELLEDILSEMGVLV